MKPLICAMMCAAAIAIARAQDRAQPPTFTSGVELVRLDVRVTAADGRPVRDLRQDEVEVIEDGEPRPVVFFQHVVDPQESYADVARHTIAGEVSTNQGALRGHLYLLFFDQTHIQSGNEQRARQAAQRFVERYVRPGDRVAVYGFGGPGPEIGFTADVKRAVSELSKVRGLAAPQEFTSLAAMSRLEAFEITRGDDLVLQRVAQRVLSSTGPTDTGRAAATSLGTEATPITALVLEDARTIANRADADSRRTLMLLADVLRPLGAIEGRKSVIFISEGFYADNVTLELEQVAAAAAQSYSVIYALDVNRRDLDLSANELPGSDQFKAIHEQLEPLGSLAAETDGMLIVDGSGRADEVFATIAAQSQDYYMVGFVPGPASERSRGSYRRVTVRTRRAGSQASARTGFVLGDDRTRLERHQAIERAMAAPFPQQGLPVQYTTYVLRGAAAGTQRVIVSLSAELPFAANDRGPGAPGAPGVDVVFVVRSASDGHVAASGHDTLTLPARRGAHGTQTTAATGTYHVQFELPAGEYLMRAVVREPGGLVGSADRRFVVPALDGPSMTTGDLILSSTRGELPVRPTAYINDGLSGVMDLYDRTSDRLRAAQVTVDLVPIGDDASMMSGRCDLQDIRSVIGGLAREARIELPLRGVAAGMYIARARVRVGAETIAEVVREVEIRNGQRPSDADEADGDAFDPREIADGAVARHFSIGALAQKTQAIDRLRHRDYPAAIAAFQSVLASEPDNGEAAFLLGWAYHGAGDDRQAITAWRRAAFVAPTLVPAHLALADMFTRLAQPDLAVQALRSGLTAVPQSPELLAYLAHLQRK